MVIYTRAHLVLAFIIGVVAFYLVIRVFGEYPKQEEKSFTQIPLTKCDSLVMANDSLVTRMVTLENRLLQYQTGLSFLKDKDKRAYDYAINAGNLKFEDLW